MAEPRLPGPRYAVACTSDIDAVVDHFCADGKVGGGPLDSEPTAGYGKGGVLGKQERAGQN